MRSGEIGEDIAHYLIQSHQIRSLVSLGVYLDEFGKVKAAGGVIIEVMPGVEEEIVDKIEKNAAEVKGLISELILKGQSEMEIISPYFKGVPFTELDHNYPVVYHCPCTKERVSRAIELLGQEELEDMIQKKEVAQVQCQMCGRKFELQPTEIQEVRDRLYRSSLH
jgi:molecular chaperone Hsp33